MIMKTNGYSEYFSKVYDSLISDINYSQWADFYELCFKKFSSFDVKNICEIACGSGTMSIELEKRGYILSSSDLSEEMLSLAENKSRNANCRNITFTKQDIRSFVVYSKADAVICMLDSINCLTSPKYLEECFNSTKDALKDGGLFIFDINSKFKFENVYSDNAYILEDDGVLCAWQNFYNSKSKVCDFLLSFFIMQSDGMYERHNEDIRQKMYTVKTISNYLSKSGFEICGIFCDFDFTKADENKDERIFFVARKRI